jgi:phosphatidylglycerophosphatase A
MQLPEPLWPRQLSDKLVLNLATLGPVGRRLPAPGTWGSLAGLAYAWLIYREDRLDPMVVAEILIGLYLAVGICGEAARRLGRTDPGEVILDEFAVMPLCYLFWQTQTGWPDWAVLLTGFALFRFYDILKPLGIRRLQSLPGGWGIVADDVAAALAACATLHLAAWGWACLA